VGEYGAMIEQNNNIKNLINTICRRKSIVDYLAKKGHHPVKQMAGGKVSYCCPLPDHKETKPSFVVYTQDAYEKYYCFGCQSKLTIVDLVAGLEKITWKEALCRLADGIELSFNENVSFSVEEVAKLMSDEFEDSDVLEDMASMSSFCSAFLASTNYDPVERDKVDLLYSKIDKDLFDYDFDSIHETVSNLQKILFLRIKKFRKMELEKIKQNLG
jgi:DNA primase